MKIIGDLCHLLLSEKVACSTKKASNVGNAVGR
jgi:hypothetical protein